MKRNVNVSSADGEESHGKRGRGCGGSGIQQEIHAMA